MVADRQAADGPAFGLRLYRVINILILAEFSFTFCERARVNVRAKGRAVNSVFLVQLRKMSATDFRGSTRMKNFLENVTLSRTEGAGSVCERA